MNLPTCELDGPAVTPSELEQARSRLAEMKKAHPVIYFFVNLFVQVKLLPQKVELLRLRLHHWRLRRKLHGLQADLEVFAKRRAIK